MRVSFILFTVFLFCVSSYGQSISGNIEDISGEKVAFANVVLFSKANLVAGTTSDIYGKFEFKKIDAGNYNIEIKIVGYQDTIISVKLKSVDTNLKVVLEHKNDITYCPIIEIEIHPLSNHFEQKQNRIIVSQSSKDMAGTFDDPSRVLIRHTGISTSNDQANGIVYRGLSPDLIKWSMDGAEIVNPNHLSNAGTISDVTSLSAGGVLAVPFDVIDKFEFSGQPSSSNQLNTISGVSDLSFKDRGNTFIELGLLGMEAGFQSKGDLNIMAQARYSTVGLLGDLGIDFDGESIKFQDYFLKAEIAPRFTFTGILARSTNEKSFEDFPPYDQFSSDLRIAGLNYFNSVSKHSLYFSNKSDYNGSAGNDFNLSQSKLSYHGETFYKSLDFWWNVNYSRDQIDEYKNDYLMVQHGLAIKRYINGDKFDFFLQPSLDFVVDTYWPEFNFEPAILLQIIKGNSIIQVNSSLKSQMQSAYLYRAAPDELQRSKSASASISYKLNYNNYQFLLRSFYNYYYDLPSNGTFSYDVNGINSIRLPELDNIGSGRSYGFEFMYDLKVNEGLYINVNTTFFDTKFDGKDAVFNFGHTSNFVVTKKIEKPNLNISIAAHHRGGAYDRSLYNSELYEMQLGNYFRVDLRTTYSWKDKNVLTLDIQNITNRLNDASFNLRWIDQGSWADPILEVTKEKQLGIIPILSYKRIIN